MCVKFYLSRLIFIFNSCQQLLTVDNYYKKIKVEFSSAPLM